MSKPKIELVMDSGAFSAFTQGKPVDLVQYTDFLLANPKHIKHAVALDFINPNDPEVAAATGWSNLQYMKGKGVDAVPVYHARENLGWFDKMLDTCKYIGISGTSLVSPTEHLAFYDLAWHYGTDSSGFPLAKFHAFGDTAAYSLLTYPWYSCDSATWMIQAGRAGAVKLQGKSFNILSKKVRDNNFITADMLGPQKDSWEYECRSLGLKPEKLFSVEKTASQVAMLRSYLVASDTLKLRDRSIGVDRFRKPPTLISKKKTISSNPLLMRGMQRLTPPTINFVISPSAYYFNFPVIHALGIENILVSYYYIFREKPAFWNEKLVPFLYDPKGFCNTDPKTKRFWDKLQEVLLHPIQEDIDAATTGSNCTATTA